MSRETVISPVLHRVASKSDTMVENDFADSTDCQPQWRMEVVGRDVGVQADLCTDIDCSIRLKEIALQELEEDIEEAIKKKTILGEEISRMRVAIAQMMDVMNHQQRGQLAATANSQGA